MFTSMLDFFQHLRYSVVILLCKGFRSLNSYVAHLLSRENKYELCLFARLSSKIIRGPSLSENDSFVCEMNVKSAILSKTIFTKQSILHIALFKKSEHPIKQVVASRPQFPLSTNGTPGTMTPFWRPRTALLIDLYQNVYCNCK